MRFPDGFHVEIYIEPDGFYDRIQRFFADVLRREGVCFLFEIGVLLSLRGVG